MATIKSYTDINQSRKLAEILPLESADATIIGEDNIIVTPYNVTIKSQLLDFVKEDNIIPCWSLAALFGVLPKLIGDYSKCLYYDVDGCYCGYMNDGDFMLTIKETRAGNPVDACVKMIERLHELNLL